MRDGAKLKIERAARGITELESLFSKRPPFTYVIETNTSTRERAIFANKNQSSIDDS